MGTNQNTYKRSVHESDRHCLSHDLRYDLRLFSSQFRKILRTIHDCLPFVVFSDFQSQDVIGFLVVAPLSPVADTLDSPRRLFAADHVFRPAAPVQGKVNQLGSRIRFVQWHCDIIEQGARPYGGGGSLAGAASGLIQWNFSQ